MDKCGCGVVVVVIVAWAFAGYCRAYSGGTGEPNSPFEIGTAADWQELMEAEADWDKHFVLTSDIDLEVVALSPVGNEENNFTGVFDGNDHVIRNADINLPGTDYVGLFGYVGSATIASLAVEDVAVMGRGSVGGLVGFVGDDGVVSNCRSSGSVTGSGTGVGGLVGGCRFDVSISNCHANGLVNGEDGFVGGLVGSSAYGGRISNCSVTGSVGSFRNYVGGLVGSGDYGVTISSCYATGSISGNYYVGGLVGNNNSSVKDCYATGSVSGGGYVGGLVGHNRETTIYSSYATGSVTGNSRVGGLVGMNFMGGTLWCFHLHPDDGGGPVNHYATALRDWQMREEASFVGWDFVGEGANGVDDVWGICEGMNYPRLVWQIPSADFVCPDGVGFEDFGELASYWRASDGGDVELDGEDGIGFGDLEVLCGEWLLGR